MLEGGYHLVLDLEGCNRRHLDSKGTMLKLCRGVADLMRASVIMAGAHRFSPHGVTAFAVIAESHVSVHTWPESGKAFLDVFTCQERADLHEVVDFVVGALSAKRGRAVVLLRDSQVGRRGPGNDMPFSTFEFDFGRPIFRTRSRYQTIEITKGPMGISLFLNGFWQFVEQYEHVYHEVLMHPALVCAPQIKRVGIGGGGDGLALREVLRYRELGHVWMYELDPKMLDVARSHPEMVRLNRKAIDHAKATVVADDARRMLRPKAAFDVLVFDFPSLSDGTTFGPLYSTEMYRTARRALAPGGILVTQAIDPTPHLLRTIVNLRSVFEHVLPFEVRIGNSVFSFVAACNRPFRQRRPLPRRLRFLTQERLMALLAGRPVTDSAQTPDAPAAA